VTNVVEFVAFSLVGPAVTARNFWLFSCSDWLSAASGNCVVFSGNLSLAAVVAAAVLFSSELLIDELTAGRSVADLLESEETLFDAIRFGLVKGSPKPESSLPIRGSTSEFVVSLRVLLVIRGLVLAEGMLLISEALLIINVSTSVRLNSDAGTLAGSIKLGCSEFSEEPGV